MMTLCRRHLKRGKHELSRHHPESALKSLESALKLCPVEQRHELTQIFYYLGLTLLRLGNRSGAVRSFRAGSRLRKRACYSRKMFARFGNAYGMVRQATPELDDWRAFYSIQLQRYLRATRSHRVESEAEGDMIADLIRDYWQGIQERHLLDARTPQEKLELFRSVKIIFPTYLEDLLVENDTVISVDFHKKVKLEGDNRCGCGSGMPYMMCCGRTQAAEDATPGTF